MSSEVRIVDGIDALYREAEAEFVKAVLESVASKKRFDVVLSGGSTPKGLFERLALNRAIPWDKVTFFWGDERHVPPDHPDSNYRMANLALLSKLDLERHQVWRIQGELADADKAARNYEQDLRDCFVHQDIPEFDLVLLGMGPDGHTASLFPGTAALHETARLVVANHVPKLNTDRITMAAPLINHAARVMFLVSGEDKAASLKAVLEGPYDPDQFPSQLIQPQGGRLIWLIEKSAGGMLKPL